MTKNRLFLGSLGGADEFFGVPRPPWGGGTPKNPFLPPHSDLKAQKRGENTFIVKKLSF